MLHLVGYNLQTDQYAVFDTSDGKLETHNKLSLDTATSLGLSIQGYPSLLCSIQKNMYKKTKTEDFTLYCTRLTTTLYTKDGLLRSTFTYTLKVWKSDEDTIERAVKYLKHLGYMGSLDMLYKSKEPTLPIVISFETERLLNKDNTVWLSKQFSWRRIMYSSKSTTSDRDTIKTADNVTKIDIPTNHHIDAFFSTIYDIPYMNFGHFVLSMY